MEKKGNTINNIAIVGLFPEYNNQVASLIADQLEMYFLDVEALFEFDLSPITVTDLVKQNGRRYFREKQMSTVSYVASFKNTIMTYESGVLLSPAKVKVIEENSLIIYLHHDINRIKKYQNTKDYSTKEIKQLFCLKDPDIARRSYLGKKYADITVNASKISVFKCMSEVIRQIKKYYEIEEG